MFDVTGFDGLQTVIGVAKELNKSVIIAHGEVYNIYNDISVFDTKRDNIFTDRFDEYDS